MLCLGWFGAEAVTASSALPPFAQNLGVADREELSAACAWSGPGWYRGQKPLLGGTPSTV